MKVRNKVMQTAVIIFLLAAVIVLFVVLFKLRNELDVWRDRAVERSMMLDSAITDKRIVIKEKAEIEAERDKLAAENSELKAALSTKKEKAEVAEPSPNASKERLPEGVATNRYDCEGYAFPEGTQQARLQNECFTDRYNGLRIYEPDNAGIYADDYSVFGYYCVAMGTAYGVDIGDAWFVKLKNGNGFNIILADYQHDISDPDPNDFGECYEYDAAGNIVGPLRNYDGEECVHVLEFIADLDRLPKAAKEAGGMHGLSYFGGKFGDGGNIESIKYLGRKWEP